MGRYKLAFYWNWQVGFMFGYGDKAIEIGLPFMSIWICWGLDAKGLRFFNY